MYDFHYQRCCLEGVEQVTNAPSLCHVTVNVVKISTMMEYVRDVFITFTSVISLVRMNKMYIENNH